MQNGETKVLLQQLRRSHQNDGFGALVAPLTKLLDESNYDLITTPKYRVSL